MHRNSAQYGKCGKKQQRWRTTSAIEGWNELCNVHQQDSKSTKVAWIYEAYTTLIMDELWSSHCLQASGFVNIMLQWHHFAMGSYLLNVTTWLSSCTDLPRARHASIPHECASQVMGHTKHIILQTNQHDCTALGHLGYTF